MEICDVFTEAGTRTGHTVARGTQLRDGEYYLVVQVWIRNEVGAYLIQRRALHLVSGPGMWATTAGYVLAGEESLAAAVREVHEEIGIHLSTVCLSRFERLIMNGLIQDIWLADVQENSLGAVTLGAEVIDWKWASKNEIKHMISLGSFFAYSYFDALPE